MKMSTSIIAAVALVGIGTLYGLIGVNTIVPGEVGLDVVMIETFGEKRGISKTTLDTGVRWVEPITHDVEKYDTRDKQYSIYAKGEDGIPSTTKDGQPILLDLTLQLGLIDAKVPHLHETVGKNWFFEVVYPAARSIARKYPAGLESEFIYTQKGREQVQNGIEEALTAKLKSLGIRIEANLRDIKFTNKEYVATLEEKAGAAQQVIIEERNAEAAEQIAIKVANTAEGAKQKKIKEAEAERERLKLEGEGARLRDEELAKGILAIALAKAKGTREQVKAYGSGETYASVKWAENLAPKLTVWGVPTGSPGTGTMMDLNGMLKGAFAGKVGK